MPPSSAGPNAVTGSVLAPGPGRWTRDAARYPRPVTPTLAGLLPGAAVSGFSAATRAYGLLLDHIEWAFTDGWAYMAPRRFPPLRGADLRDRRAWAVLVDGSSDLRRRLGTSARVFERRVWRGELERWHGRDRPASIESNSVLGRVDPAALDDAALVRHLGRCRANLRAAIRLHHRFDVTPAVAVGDLLALVADWSGAPPAAHLDLLTQGSRPALAAAELPEVTGGGWWIAGATCDIDEPCFAELPEVFTDALRAAARSGEDADAAARDAVSRVRALAPAGRRDELDGMVADARAVHRLRDERALYCDVWATGVLRRAVLAAGERLCARGLLDAPADAVEASPAELRGLLTRRAGPDAAELSARARSRRAADGRGLPAELGDAPWAPIPVDWLPPGAARTERAFRTFLGAMEDGSDDARSTATALQGLPASPGVHAGRARLVRGAADLARVEAGDVLVAPAASPSLVVAFPLAGAMVTDHGGMLSHAAIVAREHGIPAVVGTGDATARILDGARVRVDGSSGSVTLVDR